MAKSYEVDLFDIDSITKFEKVLMKMTSAIKGEEFMQFVAGKCMIELNRISNERLNGFTDKDMFSSEVDKYRTNHKVDIKPKEITIYNDTMADLSHVSDRTLANYPEGFSIAKAIEFGTGILGSPNDEFEWETQVNPNRDYEKGWYYERDGQLYWSKGFGGKFIYYELVRTVESKLQEWFNEFLDSKLD